MRSVRSLALAAFVFLAALPLVAAPTAILVDTSRSIPPAQFEALKGRIDGLLPDLLSRGPAARPSLFKRIKRIIGASRIDA